MIQTVEVLMAWGTK